MSVCTALLQRERPSSGMTHAQVIRNVYPCHVYEIGTGGGNFCYEIRTSNQSRLHSPQKIFAIGPDLLQRLRLISIFQRDLLQKQFDRVLRLEPLHHQLSDPWREALLIRHSKSCQMVPALMLAKPPGRQPG